MATGVLLDFDGRAGTLWSPDWTDALASGVASNEYIGLETMPYGLAYLTHYNPRSRTGELDDAGIGFAAGEQ